MTTNPMPTPSTGRQLSSADTVAAAAAGITALDVEQRTFLEEATAATAAVDAAEQLGVFTRLAAGPLTAPLLAQDCALGARGAALLLAALASLGIVATTGDGLYHLATTHATYMRAYYAPLAQVILDDRPLLAADTVAGAATLYQNAVPLLGKLFALAAQQAALHLKDHGLRVLDVGAGAAPWSLALATHDPSCRVTVVDLPAVLAATRQAVATAGCEAQYTYLPGDFFALDWQQTGYDLAIAGNICHLFDAAANRRLLHRLCNVLKPGGRLAIIDALPNEEGDGPRSVALYALGLMLRTGSGSVYPFSTFATWLREAGFVAIEPIELTAQPPLSLISAYRP